MNSRDLADLMAENGIPVAPLNTPEDVLEDPHINFGEKLIKVHGGDRDMRLPALPYESTDYHFTKRSDPPGRPGAHTRQVLAEAGYSPDRIEALLQNRTVKEL